MTLFSESLRSFLKPVLSYLDDDSVSEILINAPDDVWVERDGKLLRTDARFTSEGLAGAARNIAQFVGRVLSDERPQLDARLPDGSRIHVVLPPIARHGPTLTIRKFFKEKLRMGALLKMETLTPPMARLLEAAIHLKLNIICSGGTGSGKTTLLNVLSTLIPENERIVTIEDSAELNLSQTHVVGLESRPADKNGKGAVDLGDLLNSALRLRPDRIIVGETRGPEAYYLVQAMNTGHGGLLVTVHANSPTDALRRIEALSLMNAADLPLVAVRAQVASAANLVITCERLSDGTRKVTRISEVLPLTDRGEYRAQDIFVFTPIAKNTLGRVIGYHGPTGIVPHFTAKARAMGFTDLDDRFFEPATYRVPPPPVFSMGEELRVRWVPSLEHRERGEQDPAALHEARREFEETLRHELADSPPLTHTAPTPLVSPAPVRTPAPAPATSASAHAGRVLPKPLAKPLHSATGRETTRPEVPLSHLLKPDVEPALDDAVDQAIASARATSRPVASPNEPKVQLSHELLQEAEQVEGKFRTAKPSVPPRRARPETRDLLDEGKRTSQEVTQVQPVPNKYRRDS
jgi:pilus assembly protein CpaF